MSDDSVTVALPRRGHIIVVGAHTLGAQVVEELLRMNRAPLVVVERNGDRVRALRKELETSIPAVIGDAMEEATLASAHIADAQGLVTTLGTDRDNLFLCLTARQMSPFMRIVARLGMASNAVKFRNVGADEVVSTETLGGRRLTHAMLRPELATFSDALAGSEEKALLLLEIPVHPHSPVAGLRLSTAGLEEQTGCVIVGYRRRTRGGYTYRPDPQSRLVLGSGIVALGDDDELLALAGLLSGEAAT